MGVSDIYVGIEILGPVALGAIFCVMARMRR
jgi:hypothetical protein